MTDAVAGEALIEQEVAAVAPVLDEGPSEVTPPHPVDVDAEAASPAPDEPVAASSSAAPATDRTLPEIEHPIGPLRQAVLDALVDTDEPQSVARILAAMPPGTTRGSGESAIKREFDQGRIIRTSPGHYVLAPAQPPKPAPPPTPPLPTDEAIWLAALERWVVDRASWDVEELGPPPNDPANRIPPDIRMRFADRPRKREQRRKEADEAAARRTAADAELRDRLIAATGGNVIRGPGIEDVTPIKLALELVPLDRVLSSIRSKTHKKLYPGNEPAKSWSERRLLKAVAEDYCSSEIVPRLVEAWSKAGRTPAKATEKPNAAPAVQVPTEPEDAPAPPPQQRDTHPAADAAELGSEAAALLRQFGRPDVQAAFVQASAGAMKPPDVTRAAPAAPPDGARAVAAGRDQVLAAFNRTSVP
jgi:hypothetical protein